MNTMYKEIVETKKAPRIVGGLLLVSLMIVVANGVADIRFFQYRIGYLTDPLLKIVACMIMAIEFIKCKVRYRYSIIADQLIIHKLKDNRQYTAENIKLQNIIFVGKMSDLNKKLNIISSKNYVCSVNMFERYCCVYKDGNAYRKFYFQPSSNLLMKLNNILIKSKSLF